VALDVQIHNLQNLWEQTNKLNRCTKLSSIIWHGVFSFDEGINIWHFPLVGVPEKGVQGHKSKHSICYSIEIRIFWLKDILFQRSTAYTHINLDKTVYWTICSTRTQSKDQNVMPLSPGRICISVLDQTTKACEIAG
jgi:hypothetical protein